MRIFNTLALLLLSISPQTVLGQALVLTGGEIYTVDENRSWVEAIAIDENGIITAVGTQSSVFATVGTDAKIVDLGGRMVLPGFQDVHLHAVEAGVNAVLCLFEPFDDLNGYRQSVMDCAEDSETGDWVLAAGVNMTALLDLHPNPVEVLDEVVPDRPVLILDDIGHGAWANSKALQAAGYDTAPDAPNGNIILRNQAGTPNGVVLENAPNNLRTLAFPPTEENLNFAYDSLLSATAELNANGITSVSDAGGYWPQGHHKVWDWAEEEEALTVRASNAFYIYPDRPLEEQLAELRTLYHNDPDRLVRFNQAKIYVDGILSQATGALLSPYEPGLGLEPDEEYGYLYFPEEALKRAARELSAAGFQLHFHVTGDYGARLALDAIEEADPTAGPHRLTHLYLIDPSDYPRFAELNAVADIQLAPSALDVNYVGFMEQFLGQRASHLLAAGDLINAGATVTLSSDWDADELNPMIKIAAAVGRKHNGFPDVATAIEAMTINPAYLLQHDDRTGSIEVGKFADLVIISENILDIPVDQIADVQIEATLLQGQAVFDETGLFSK
ncbi:N-substituted formamide deformylase precursor [Roseovarius albus]|uniref:N-substituted formamide deformylase n=1 Tax=Roseovarius albus TaxID=1247867 RepID=A0A1X7A409_9RHOB|nr:amidohydrolase [Roseovarius albus]SLN69833.1 N-substituted formamide deformylase precursor [Roseovarius albus]